MCCPAVVLCILDLYWSKYMNKLTNFPFLFILVCPTAKAQVKGPARFLQGNGAPVSGGAGVRGFSRPMWEGLLSYSNAWGGGLPPAGRVFL